MIYNAPLTNIIQKELVYMDKTAHQNDLTSGNFRKKYTKNIGSVFMVMFALTYTMLVYLPTDTFLNNLNDFDFNLQSFIFMMLAFAAICALLMSAIAALISTIIPKIDQQNIIGLFFGLNIAAYIQYLFMNGLVGELDGREYLNSKFTPWIMINMFIYIIVIFVPVILYKAKPEPAKKLNKYGPLLLTAMETLVILISLLISGGKAFDHTTIYFDGLEQYVISKNENIIVFVLDAVDNSYFKTILQDTPECFEGFEDYTLYTNTCSVYDSTYPSLSQMFAGMEMDNTITADELYYNTWHSDKANQFYDRFHEANYKINAYNVQNINNENEVGKFDNLKYYGQDKESDRNVNFDHKKQFKQLTAIGFFRALPLCVKYFPQVAIYSNSDVLTSNVMYKNDDFYENLDISLSQEEKNYLIIQHLYGTHMPCFRGYINETVFLLEMLNDFNSQLKELGVYDDSTIIITSDHGEHNDGNSIASTPIFMIKEKNTHRQEMKISSAPVYHEDIMSTLLVNAGLFNGEKDKEIYGPSIYDFDENSVRSRTWYDRGKDPEYPPAYKSGSLANAWAECNVYFKYTYTGDTETLIKMVDDHEITETIPMKENLG